MLSWCISSFHFLTMASVDHILCNPASCRHDDDRGQDRDDDDGKPYGLQGGPGFQKSDCRGNEHDRHDLDQKVSGFPDLCEFQDSCAERCKHQHQPVDACGDGERYQDMEQLPEKRYQ